MMIIYAIVNRNKEDLYLKQKNIDISILTSVSTCWDQGCTKELLFISLMISSWFFS